MRTISAADEALFDGPDRSTFLRVDVQDGGGTYRDMTTYLGQNFVSSATWSDSVDDEGQHGTVVFKREEEGFSVAPLVQASPANVGLVFGGSYAPLIYIGRGIRIYTADMPQGQTPGASDWRFVFDGHIDKVNEASDSESLSVDISDLQGVLRDTFIEVERVYAFATGANATKGCRVWTGLTTINQNELAIPTDANRNGHFYKDTTAGSHSTAAAEPPWVVSGSVGDGSVTWAEQGATASMTIWSPSLTVAVGDRINPTAANVNGHFYIATAITTGITSPTTEPTWPTGAGATVTDAGVTWTESGAIATAVETIMGQIAADNGQSVTVNTPGGSPGWLVKTFLQQRVALWDAVRALADQIGWDLRYQWDSGSNTFHLNLWTPNRSKSTPDRTFAASDKIKVSSLEIDISKVRNAIEVVVSASGSQDPSGNPLRASVIVPDSTSITKYGRRYMLMAEASTSNVDTTAEGTAMANAALSDLKEPNAEKAVDLLYFPFTELGDLYRFSPDAIYSDQNLDLAIVGYSHTVSAQGQATTTLTCRGKPSTGCDRWLSKDARGNADDVHALTLIDADQPKMNAAAVVGGTLLSLAAASSKRGFGQDYEWHIGSVSNFTPTQQTLLQSQGGNQAVASHLIPGKGYYAKIVPIRRNASRIVRGQPSAGSAFTAGQAASGHIQDGIALGDYPLNGGFETRVDAAGMPDHWTVYGGVLNTDVSVMEDGNGFSGNRYMRLTTHSGGIRSAVFPILNEAMETTRYGGMYRLSWWRKAGASNSVGATYNTLVRLLDSTGAEVDIITAAAGRACDNFLGHWIIEEAFVTLRAGDPSARSAQLQIIGATGATFQLDVDEYRVQFLGTPWFNVGDTTNHTDAFEAIPAFTGSPLAWVNSGVAPAEQAAFRRDQFGRIWIKGSIKSGTMGSTAFVLPATFRPAETKNFAVREGTSTTPGVLVVDTAGNVTPTNGGNTFFSLNCCFERFS